MFKICFFHKMSPIWKGDMFDFIYVVEKWLIALEKCFTMQDCDYKVKERYSITHMEVFVATWWNIEETKLGVAMNIVTRELFLEKSCDHFY